MILGKLVLVMVINWSLPYKFGDYRWDYQLIQVPLVVRLMVLMLMKGWLMVARIVMAAGDILR